MESDLPAVPIGGVGNRGLRPLMLDEPVFVLTCARSGSTLIRAILDAHPDLACPPETNIGELCAHLWNTWMILHPDCSEAALTEEARLSVRAAVSSAYRGYLKRRGKLRWCDKSLPTAEVATRLYQLYDKARFICLYRHAMDVVNSGLEATPFGLTGYGFDQYRFSANSVAALADYWTHNTNMIWEFEQAHPDICLRIYYEQLVHEPESIADDIFKFIGVGPQPGITRRALIEQEMPGRFEFGDHKIRAVQRVKVNSVGRGIRVPASLLSADQLNAMNHVLARLGYTKVDRAWRESTVPPVLLSLSGTGRGAEVQPDNGSRSKPTGDGADVPAGVPDGESDLDNFQALDDEFRRRVAQHVKTLPEGLTEWSSMAIIAYSLAPERLAAAWRVGRKSGAVDAEVDCMDFQSLDADWVCTGEIEVWRRLLNDTENLATVVRHGFIRCIGKELAADGAEAKAATLADTQMANCVQTLTHILGLGATV